ncbi:MAG: 3-deoxy-D-manno-octulosonic acid transferase, partial [Elusimicrobia bacterium]|nr:3-deoxy-D-manno-octulosonic acid transferase [Elusimicrobiota bacterium]
ALAEARGLLESLGWRPGAAPVWCAGSTRPGEEETAVLDAFLALKRRWPALRLVLAPRHVERAEELAAALLRRGIHFARLSSPAAAPKTTDCLLVDALGRLPALYALSDLAFVGGTLSRSSGHNLLEPAAAGVPVVFGPDTSSIEAPAAALERAGGGFRVPDGPALHARLEALLADPAARARAGDSARRAAAGFTGAGKRTADFLAPRLGL